MKTTRTLSLVITTALVSVSLVGCAGKAAPSAALSAETARTALAKGKGDKAVIAAEAAVLAAPRDAAARALLGAAYMEAGRFASAVTALSEAVELGDRAGRTILSQSLALSALGQYAQAQALLAQHQNTLDPADYGLAITLAGSPQQGIEALSNALRYGESTPKLRQNLAYAFALKGDWRSARLLAAQDVTADKLDQRLGEWAQMSAPRMAVQRVAALLGVMAKADAGQPTHLALARFPTNDQLAAEAATQDTAQPAAAAAEVLAGADTELPAADAITAPEELPALAAYEPAPQPASVPAPAPAPTSYTPAAPRIALPKATPTPAPVRVAAVKPVAARPSPAFAAAFVRAPGAYRVQLGSYASASAASDAWKRFQKRHPELNGAERIVTKANVGGKTFYRVAAGGFAKGSAASFCSLVRNGGGGCFAYASSRTLPGVAPSGARAATRVAAR